mmetsp:Transcript_28172/g.67831  ORF Transcript_28172/g.67831 Transcript_28172/m.67831 type:complete len:129 (+) Transcript_28172:479-865(+)
MVPNHHADENHGYYFDCALNLVFSFVKFHSTEFHPLNDSSQCMIFFLPQCNAVGIICNNPRKRKWENQTLNPTSSTKSSAPPLETSLLKNRSCSMRSRPRAPPPATHVSLLRTRLTIAGTGTTSGWFA